MRIRTAIGPLFALALAVFVAYLTQDTSGLLGLPFALTDQRAVPVFVVLAAVSAAPCTFGPMVSGGRRLKSSRRRCIVRDRLSVSDLGLEERLAWAGWQGRTSGIKQR